MPTEKKPEDCKGIMIYPQRVCITYKTMSYILADAFEGGSNYWYEADSFKEPANFNNVSEEYHEKGRKPWAIEKAIEYPLNEGGEVIILVPEFHPCKTKREGKPVFNYGKRGQDEMDDYDGYSAFSLNLTGIKKALTNPEFRKAPSFKKILDENPDSNDADAFLQFAIFGKRIFA